MTDTCRNGHLKTPENTYSDGNGRPRRCAACDRAREHRKFDERHAGHNVILTSHRLIDGGHARRCVTCSGPRAYYPPEVDDSAVLRAVMGDPPPDLNVAERREAVKKLRGELSTRLIAERIGVSPRTVWRHLASTRSDMAAAS